jgi:D-tyrosyl-tRNA(Tyr) deacylase
MVEGEITGAIERGLCVLLGIGRHDTERDAEQLADKLVGLRVFEVAAGKMNLALADVGGKLLCISQFTLFGDTSRGRRPSFVEAMEPEGARQLFEKFCDACRARGAAVETGRFRAHMDVELVNDGPVTLWLDTVSGRP